MPSEPAIGTNSRRSPAPPAGYSRAPKRSVTKMNATTTIPTSAPISSVTTRNTCSSRSLSTAAQRFASDSHSFLFFGREPDSIVGRVSLPSFLSRKFSSAVPVRRMSLVFQQRLDRGYQRRAARAQFPDTVPRHFFQQFLSARQQRNQHPPPVIPASASSHQPALLQPVHQFHNAVVLQHQPVC